MIRIHAIRAGKCGDYPCSTKKIPRPANDPGFHPVRQETSDRMIRYTLHSYATDNPTGDRFIE